MAVSATKPSITQSALSFGLFVWRNTRIRTPSVVEMITNYSTYRELIKYADYITFNSKIWDSNIDDIIR